MQQSGPRTRRNGTLQSCEPCRKSKLKCDHVTPVCGRCMAKDIAHKCFYHPSPMTRKTPGIGAVPENQLVTPLAPYQTSTPIQSPNSHVSSENGWALSGYLGPSNCFSILRDFGSEIPTAFETLHITIPRNLQPDNIQIGVEVLRLISLYPVCDALVVKFQTTHRFSGIPNSIVSAITGSIREAFERFEPATIDAQLTRFSHLIFQNSSRPMSVNKSMTVEQYCASFTGLNFRWEAIGNFFALAGMALVGTPDTDPLLLNVKINKETLLSLLIEASDICTKFCEHPSSVNELLIYLQTNDGKLKTHRYGDICYLTWRQVGVLASTLFTAGLHRGSDDDCPFFLSQWRAICFASSFVYDKSMATFMGRPPLISSRYCKISAPLDIGEEDIVAGPEALGRAFAQMDPLGWNKTASHATSLLRMRFFQSLVREEVLDVVLGQKQVDTVEFEGRANAVLDKARATWDATPSHLRFDHQEEGAPDTPANSWASRYPLVIPYLEQRYSCFLLQQAIVKQTGSGHAALFDTAREMLTTVNKVSVNREFMIDRSRHYAWLMLYYGVPGASMLAIHLLHQNQGSTTFVMPARTEVIRNLTVFVSSLSWITRPTYGNYALCKEAEKRLTAILDEILDPTPHHPPGSAIASSSPSNLNMDSLLEGYDFDGMAMPAHGYFFDNMPWP
ncbi:putative C6 transcription factor [Talaromyces proteolyticus]|uniref:C6 transcription factor n=1 Tax=Talaromyces proteolyticus TaxID=1131652 RepID=A0AAD4L3F0_9EURO|nr:putative C6 transcription factor [Talaromyces proteolyticus]KAH8702479.1 putative C6 transcription factor [Talaromyces proteolyticus]